MSTIVLPKLEIPQNSVLYYENIVINDTDRSGNWRFFIQKDGCFFDSHNETLWITDTEKLSSDDPSLFWSKNFQSQSKICFTKAQMSKLFRFFTKLNLAQSSDITTNKNIQNSTIIERWTYSIKDQYRSVIFEINSLPKEIIELKKILDQMILSTRK